MNQEMFRYLPWPFENNTFPPAPGAMVMRTVLEGPRPALQVLHDPEGGWLSPTARETRTSPASALRHTYGTSSRQILLSHRWQPCHPARKRIA